MRTCFGLLVIWILNANFGSVAFAGMQQGNVVGDSSNKIYGYYEVDSSASYLGGDSALSEYFQAKFIDRPNLKKGACLIKFVVEKDNSLTHVELDNMSEEGISSAQAELYRRTVMEMSSGWQAATINSEPVRSMLSIQINQTDTGHHAIVLIPVQKKAVFKDGINAMYAFIGKYIEVPDSVVDATVLVSFVVEKDGSISQVQLDERSIRTNPQQEEAAMDVVRKMSGLWNPAIQKNKPVRMRFSLPIKFMGNDYKSKPAKKSKGRR